MVGEIEEIKQSNQLIFMDKKGDRIMVYCEGITAPTLKEDPDENIYEIIGRVTKEGIVQAYRIIPYSIPEGETPFSIEQFDKLMRLNSQFEWFGDMKELMQV
eukprot:CAMPEP_0117428636 /NCGR_PEP_ID=MMETSP0758-20121206/8297_1 /TAXON_ID=63605 /ORGANISM="Percolomonas cosmopolitus, Strain AE-1 (ATCC 50343)" /LENGTH=101 /DNA_ID=CAMNT_0005215097 /DNA_START=41 /DNA_END=342 /DNA_ORIENTATION=-